MVTDLDEETAEEEAGQKDDPSFFQRGADEAAEPYARRVFQRVFCDDIQRVLRMDVRTLAYMYVALCCPLETRWTVRWQFAALIGRT